MTHRRALALELLSWRARRNTIRTYWRETGNYRSPAVPAQPDIDAYDAALDELETLCPYTGGIDAEDRCTLALAALRAFATALPRRPR